MSELQKTFSASGDKIFRKVEGVYEDCIRG